MRPFLTLFLTMVLAVAMTTPALAQNRWSEDQASVVATMDRLAATLAPDGLGAAAYGAILHKDYSRWTLGRTMMTGKRAWTEDLSKWFGDGWRVAAQSQNVLDIRIRGDFAFSRRIVTETYLSPEGETSSAKAALAETWVIQDDLWVLYRVNVDPVE